METDVGAWLETLGLGQYAHAFAENHIDFAVLTELAEADLKELGVSSLGHRKKLLAAISARRTAADAVAAPARSLTGERRQVTILFADLSGFTALSQSLDPEELHELVSGYTESVDRIVIDCGGSVDKHMGDGVMALFGAPVAHDDDPLRAARAALDIHEALGRLSDRAGRRLQAHIGIASGEVVAGGIGRAGGQDYTVLGDSVNLSARLVAAAGPGQTLISDEVHGALSGRAECDALGDMQFKGIDAGVRVWCLRGISGEQPAASRSPFVGRAAELEQFAGMIGACLARRSGQVVYVRGEAGIGKTRLVDEMRRIAEAQGFAVHRALVLDFGVGKGRDPIRDIVRSLLDLPASAGAEERRAMAERAVASGLVAAERLAFLYDLLDLPPSGEWRALYDAMDNAARNRGKRALVGALTEHSCGRSPLLIVVEDLHWADAHLLGHLGALAAALAGGPGLLVMTSRVEGDPIDPAWRAGCRGTPFATIDLGPLRREEALNLAGSFIDATQRLALACIDRAGGNPLFLEQLLHNAEEGSEEAIPASIQSLVLARMDRLQALDRQAFQAASVIGQRFELPLLRKLIDVPDYVCDGLLTHALVLPEGDGFLFAHALIQEGAYSSLLRARRRDLHRIAAEWFAALDPALRAQHLDRAGDERAPRAYLEAAASQRLAYHADAALRLAERGLEIVRDDDERYELICLKGKLQRDLGDITASIASYRQAIAAVSNEVNLCRAQLGLAEGLRVSEGLDEALALLEAAQVCAERHDLVPELARLHHLRGNILFPLGKIEGCRAEHERGLVYAKRSGSPEAEARSLGGLADAAYAQGRMRTAFAHFNRCVEISREHGFGRIEVANRSMAGFSRVYLNQPRQACDDGAAAVRNAALVGQPRAEMLGETINVFASYELGEYERMREHLEREMRLIRQLGARRFEAQNLEMQGRLLLDGGRREDAVALLRQALAVAREIGLQFSGPKALSALSRAVADEAERDRLLAEAEELLRRGSVGHNHLWFYRDAMEAMLVAGDAKAALRYADLLEGYAASEPLPWTEIFVARCHALAGVQRDGADAAIRQDLARIQTVLVDAGLKAFLAPIEAALAA
ncbi:Tetratricopeptide repeat-containing protein [Rhizobiales bacterium GAS113]|nr:Tetratricopeptide repeat-containing protein [Rhizobiales bacterium GAS113]SEC75823.1 Tetratricopeptide repeat-containing protein [Rhizobiales bacterium GAS188]